MTNLLKYRRWSWLLLFIPIYLFIFLKLGSTHVRLWDEGWFTVHAIEMLQNGSWIVSYFDGNPSFTASKPPLQTWLQMSSVAVLGISELSLRLPSALAAAATIFLLFGFTKKHLGEEAAWLSSLILLTSVGFIGFHTARGAEADGLLTLILFAQAISYFLFVQTKNTMWLLYLGILVSLGFLAKSVAGFLMLPGLAVYTLIHDRNLFGTLLTSWQFYAALIVVVGVVFGYLLVRDSLQPGYLDMVFRSNAGRYTNAMGHDHSFTYFITNLFTDRYVWWMPLAAIGITISFFDPSTQPLFRYSSVVALSFLLVISFSRSKLEWYDMPLYPLLAISTAQGVQTLLKLATPRLKVVSLVVLFIFPAFNMFNSAQANELRLTEMEYEAQEAFLSRAYRADINLHETVVIHDHFYGSLLFYRHMYDQKDMALKLQNHTGNLKVGDQTLINGDAHKRQISTTFDVDTIDRYRGALLLQLKKQHDTRTNSI